MNCARRCYSPMKKLAMVKARGLWGANRGKRVKRTEHHIWSHWGSTGDRFSGSEEGGTCSRYAYVCIAYWLPSIECGFVWVLYRYMHTRTHTRAQTHTHPHARTHAHTHARTYARVRTCTHTHTTVNVHNFRSEKKPVCVDFRPHKPKKVKWELVGFYGMY